VFDRSGLALKKRFSTLAGVIDQDYKDDWGLVCRNDGKAQITFEKGDKVAQFVLLPFLVAEDLEDAAETRSGGFGSTGN
jgi:dUTP pyrophosphatase